VPKLKQKMQPQPLTPRTVGAVAEHKDEHSIQKNAGNRGARVSEMYIVKLNRKSGQTLTADDCDGCCCGENAAADIAPKVIAPRIAASRWHQIIRVMIVREKQYYATSAKRLSQADCPADCA
jgi:hypothetical protein